MKKIAILLLVIFALLACSDDDDKTYSIKIRNNCGYDLFDIDISMYSLDETSAKHRDFLSTGQETKKYDFHFDKTSSNGCGKFTDIDISPKFAISYINGVLDYNLEIEMDNLQSNKILVVLEESNYQVVEL